MLWNALAVAIVGLATTLGLRFAIRAALIAELDEVLKNDAQEVLLGMQVKYPSAYADLCDDLTRKAQAHQLHGWYVRLIDHRGTQIWASPHAPPQTPLVPSPRGLAAVDKGDYRLVQFTYLEQGKDGLPVTVRVGSSLTPFRRDMSRIDQLALIVATIVCIVSPLAGYWLAGTVLRPLSELTWKADELRPNRLDERLPIRGAEDELDQLSLTINRLLDRLARHVQQRQDFLANAAHELRTPLAALRSTIEVTLDRNRSASEYQEVLVRLTEDCDALESLVNQLLLLAESETPREAVVREPVDWAMVVRTAVAMFEAAAEFKGVRLEAEIPSPLMVRANRNHLRQVVNNLIDNAVKYTLPGGRVMVRLFRLEAEDYGQLIVEDTGIGIKSEDVPRVFERFFRADKARHKDAGIGGTGLGLSICESVVVAHGGIIGLESKLGQGTKVTVRLPLVVS